MKIEKRTESLSIIRKDKKVPGVIYGKAFVSESIQADESELTNWYREHGLTKTFKVKLGSKTHLVYIKQIQKHVINSKHFLNFALLKVGKGDTIKASVNINIIGKENIEENKFELHNLANTLDIEYIVGSGVSHIDVDISNMKIGDVIYAKDIVLAESIELLDDPDKIIVGVREIVLRPDEDEEPKEEEMTEPELVTKKEEE
ncbi:MAG: 50S ribosomal protein L25 [Tenericutes bacterium]|nr:50S ribosomal protein L25 [Mycoplasmatota bacterium]